MVKKMNNEIYEKLVNKFGNEKQINQAIEEMNELCVALNHYRRGKNNIDEVIGEMADVLFMLGQIRFMFNLFDKVDFKVKEIEDRWEKEFYKEGHWKDKEEWDRERFEENGLQEEKDY